jgi:hypothetical protein
VLFRSLASRIVAEGLSVRAVEEIIATMKPTMTTKKKSASKGVSGAGLAAAELLSDYLDTRVSVESGKGKGKIDMSLPLRYFNRGAQASGRVGNTAPSLETTKVYWEILQRYLAAFEENIKKLEPIVQPIAIQNTVIVMVCNFGQSELLMNFICHAKRRNLDLSNVLIFATDEETRDLVASMNIAVFYDEYNYENMPKEAAKRYADRTFRSMMLSKVFCVQMVLSLGYDVLFQGKNAMTLKGSP